MRNVNDDARSGYHNASTIDENVKAVQSLLEKLLRMLVMKIFGYFRYRKCDELWHEHRSGGVE